MKLSDDTKTTIRQSNISRRQFDILGSRNVLGSSLVGGGDFSSCLLARKQTDRRTIYNCCRSSHSIIMDFSTILFDVGDETALKDFMTEQRRKRLQPKGDVMQIVWVNIKDNHFKIWGCDCFTQANGETEVIAYYGKIGLSMQKLHKHRKEFNTYADAYDYIRNKIDEKACKGYMTIANGKYFDLINCEKPLSTLVKYIEKAGKSFP